ncbi:MAG: hypothetical protein JNK14_16060 [Chitinophagaceae bacterium]|nr:hypothetical protein [Chitinophagaceae bacterium]
MRRYALEYLPVLFVILSCMCMTSVAQQPIKEKSVRPDSVSAVITDNINAAGKKATKKAGQLDIVAKQSLLPVISPEKRLMDSLLNNGKSITQSILAPVSFFKKGSPFFRINNINADIEYIYLHDTSGLSTGFLNDIRSTVGYDLSVSISLASMPFDARLAGNNGIYNFYNTPFNNFPQFNFDHKKYLEMLQKQVLDKVNPERVLSSVLSRINTIKSQYENSLKSEIKKIEQEYAADFKSDLGLPLSIIDLSVNDLSGLKSRVISQDVLDGYRQGSELYQELGSGGGIFSSQSDSLQRMALQKIGKYEALGKIYNKITSWKEKFDSNPLVKELRSHLPFTPGNFKSFIKKPSNLVAVIKGHASLSGIQKLFLNVTRLDIGANPLSGGELNLQNLMNNGINAEFTGNRSSAGIIYGSGSSNVNNWAQAGLTSFTSNEYSKLMGIKFGSGWNSNVKQSLSVNFFDFNASQDLMRSDPAMMQSGYLSTPGRRDAVITWQSSFDISLKHKISVDLSRSFGSYNNNFSEDSSITKNNAHSDVFGNNGKSNFAATIDYRGDIFKTDVQATFRKAGLGYSNPGNVFIRKGESRIGLSLGRKFLKQKLTVRYKTDYRDQYFDPARNFTYHNFSNNIQMGYRVKRSTRFGVALRHNSYRFKNDRQTASVNGSGFTLQGDAGYQFRISSKKILSNVSLSRQSFDIPMLTGDQYTSNTWLFSHTSSMILNKNMMTLSVLVNQSDNKAYYFNTSSFNTEVNYAYAINDKIRFSSGAGFYSNTGWNKQAGLKHQISGTLFKKLDIDIDMTWRKAVQTIRKELANQVYMGSSVHYRF